jgi:hypothetical protein
MMKLNKKQEENYDQIKIFLTTPYHFDNTKAQKLSESLSEIDKKEFPFDMKAINWKTCADSYVLGVKKFLMKEDCSAEAIRKGQQKIQR